MKTCVWNKDIHVVYMVEVSSYAFSGYNSIKVFLNSNKACEYTELYIKTTIKHIFKSSNQIIYN